MESFCGHASDYIIYSDEGTAYCALCEKLQRIENKLEALEKLKIAPTKEIEKSLGKCVDNLRGLFDELGILLSTR